MRPFANVVRMLGPILNHPFARHELVAASVGSLLLRGAGMGATFALGVQLARYLGPAELGIYGMVISATMLVSAFGQLGLPTLATREVAVAWARRDYPGLRGLLRWFGLTSLCASVLLALTLVVWANLWSGLEPGFVSAVLVGAPLVPLFALTVLASAELRALDRLVLGQSLEILVRPLVSCVLLAIAFLLLRHLDAQLALALTVTASTVALLLASTWVVRQLPPEARAARPELHARHWIRSAWPLAVSDIFRQLDGSYAILLMGLLTTTYQTGIFRVAQSTMLALAIPVFAVQVVVAPTLARLHESGDRAKLQRLLAYSAAASFIGALVGLAVIVAAGPGIVAFVFGRDFASSWPPLVMLCLAQLANAFFGVGFVLLPMAGAGRELTISFAVSVTISVLSAVPLITLWGATGAAIAAIIGTLTNGLLTRHFARDRIGVETSLIAWVLYTDR